MIEMILVILIIAGLLTGVMAYLQQRTLQRRIDKTALEMKKIMQVATAYYINNAPPVSASGGWPQPAKGAAADVNALNCLKGLAAGVTGCILTPPIMKYLPNSFSKSTWGEYYRIGLQPGSIVEDSPTFFVWTAVTQNAGSSDFANGVAQRIAHLVPLGYTSSVAPTFDATTGNPLPPAEGTACTSTTTTCYVVASINFPVAPTTLTSNDSAVISFAGIYHHGGCVPVPTCPTAGDIPQIFVMPTSVSGAYEGSTGPNNLYRLNSFTAYATSESAPDGNPPVCDNPPFPAPPQAPVNCNAQGHVAGMKYWRACMQIITEAGVVTGNNWGQYVSLLAIVRCQPAAGEPSGSDFSVFED